MDKEREFVSFNVCYNPEKRINTGQIYHSHLCIHVCVHVCIGEQTYTSAWGKGSPRTMPRVFSCSLPSLWKQSLTESAIQSSPHWLGWPSYKWTSCILLLSTTLGLQAHSVLPCSVFSSLHGCCESSVKSSCLRRHLSSPLNYFPAPFIVCIQNWINRPFNI